MNMLNLDSDHEAGAPFASFSNNSTEKKRAGLRQLLAISRDAGLRAGDEVREPPEALSRGGRVADAGRPELARNLSCVFQ